MEKYVMVSRQTLPRRQLLRGLGCLATLWAAQSGMTRRALGMSEGCRGLAGGVVSWIVPYSPGGGYDAYSRLLEPFLEEELGAEIAVTNLPGAGGVLGAKTLANATPDGRTLGLLNATGLLIGKLAGQRDVPSPTEDFTLLGRLARDLTVWVTAAGSGLATITDVRARATRGAILFGVTGVGSDDWFAVAVGSALLGIEAQFLTGYPGTQEALLGLIRGEFDIHAVSWSSSRAAIEAGELRPVLQITDAPIAPHPALRDVPVLGGAQGLAVRRAASARQQSPQVQARADALVEILGAGRVVAAPAGMDPELAACLEDRLFEAMTAPEFQAVAQQADRPLDPARGSDAIRTIREAEGEAAAFAAMIEQSLQKLRD